MCGVINDGCAPDRSRRGCLSGAPKSLRHVDILLFADIYPVWKETQDLIDPQAAPSSTPMLVVRVCAVIVLYKIKASDCPSLQTLLAAGLLRSYPPLVEQEGT